MFGNLLAMIIDIYVFGLFAYVVLSWIKDGRVNEIKNKIGKFYEPVLEPIRNGLERTNIVPKGVDLSPIALFFLVSIGKRLMLPLLVF